KYEEEMDTNGKSKFHRLIKETHDLLAGFCKTFRQMDDFYEKVIDEHLNPQRKILVMASLLSREQIKGVIT
ncbi:hypothetical protein MKX01_027710, partial [Papaver californicum]